MEIVATPLSTARTNPVEFTVATDGLLLYQIVTGTCDVAGVNTTIDCEKLFFVRVIVGGPKYIPAIGAMTVTRAIAVLFPSTDVATIDAEPPPLAVTNPLLLTVITAGFVELH